MAYCTIDFQYGDHSMLEGFRLYRNDILRQTCLPHERQFKDNVDDFPDRTAKYEVRAYDDLDRESFGCNYTEVLLASIVTPIMTSDVTPSGDITMSVFPVEYVYTNNVQPYTYFDRSLITPTTIALSLESGLNDVDLEQVVTYRFSEETRITSWGWYQEYHLAYTTSGASLDTCELLLYGSNEEGELGLLIDTQIYNKALSSRQYLYDISPVSFKHYSVRAKIGLSTGDHNTTGLRLYTQLYLMDRLENV